MISGENPISIGQNVVELQVIKKFNREWDEVEIWPGHYSFVRHRNP